MGERVIFEYRSDGDGASLRFGRGRFPGDGFAPGVPGPMWNIPVTPPGRRARRRRQVRRALMALQRLYDELYGAADSTAGR
jgi:hypothetical protein